MKAGGRGGDGDLTGGIGVNGLVAFAVGRRGGRSGRVGGGRGPEDVGWKRDFAEAVGESGDGFVAGRGETHEGGTVGFAGDDFAGERAHGIGEGGADGEFFAGFDETAPRLAGVAFGGAEEEALDEAAGKTARVEAGGEDGGGVAEERIAGSEEARQISEGVMGERTGGAVDDEQARLVAARGGSLGDEARGEVVVEEIGGERRQEGKMRLALAEVASFFRSLRGSSGAIQSADIAQLVEQLIRNEQVIGSSPIVGSIFRPAAPGCGVGSDRLNCPRCGHRRGRPGVGGGA